MPFDAVLDVAYTLLLDRAETADATAEMLGGVADNVERLHRALGLADGDGDSDADVIVLAEYTPAQLAQKLLAEGPGV